MIDLHVALPYTEFKRLGQKQVVSYVEDQQLTSLVIHTDHPAPIEALSDVKMGLTISTFHWLKKPMASDQRLKATQGFSLWPARDGYSIYGDFSLDLFIENRMWKTGVENLHLTCDLGHGLSVCHWKDVLGVARKHVPTPSIDTLDSPRVNFILRFEGEDGLDEVYREIAATMVSLPNLYLDLTPMTKTKFEAYKRSLPIFKDQVFYGSGWPLLSREDLTMPAIPSSVLQTLGVIA